MSSSSGSAGAADRSAGLAALADPTRRQVLDLLSEQGPLTASALANHVDISRQGVSKHLTSLERAGLVSRRGEGRAVLFAIDRHALEETSTWLAATTQRWNARLDRLGDLLDGD